ncbi:MAG: patatin-like phospholipase family protein, partial [Bacteroidota bacterium]
VLGEITLGSDQIKTGLCIIAKRADTNSVWHLMNHPRGQFYDSDQGQNKDIPLWQAVRASSAAPTYFVPQMINVGHSENAAFVDGGVSSANNPALQLLMVATMKGFPFHWEFGTDKLELVSLGTGYSIFKKQVGEIEDSHLLNWASSVPDMLMQDSNWENQLMLQWISKSPTAVELDLQKGDLKDDLLGNKALIKYLRYDVELSEENLNKLDLGHFDKKRVDDVVEMSNAHNRELLFDIGVQSSDQLKAEHF